ncbi:hypothetical protein G7K_6784-t1 [Saitoella complicata NRRL Y-17804]|uniref:DASH complex subunit DAD1 n=1 Tax=Saitoella complicata (strain BCRC 22490 / CBS 7301 / JCM 7358 / NBRC 10748 / NRRL Y-17804) TaxID=698492 RepID=A0A0E9NSG3_SAICN|nr:hypothetical protein G7K_6784-t1 [Saitoella complicata NRRL Y-17804]
MVLLTRLCCSDDERTYGAAPTSTNQHQQTTTMAEQPQSAFSGSEFFEKERARLVGEIGQSMEQIITNLNLLNRNLEGVVAVGKEFESVQGADRGVVRGAVRRLRHHTFPDPCHGRAIEATEDHGGCRRISELIRQRWRGWSVQNGFLHDRMGIRDWEFRSYL